MQLPGPGASRRLSVQMKARLPLRSQARNDIGVDSISRADPDHWEAVTEVTLGGATQIRTGDKGFAVLCLTTWPWRLNQEAV